MSQFQFDPTGFALGRAVGDRIRQQHAELVKAIKKGRSAEPESPEKKRYKLLAANGVDLIAHCYRCNSNLRFLPEYAGDTIECLNCKKDVLLYLPEDLTESRCFVCNASIIHRKESIYRKCETHHSYILGICPYCETRFSVQETKYTVCPNSSCKRKLARPKLVSCGDFTVFKKRGFFS